MSRSAELFAKAQTIFSGGVNSPVRAFKNVDLPHPLFLQKGQGAYVYDADGEKYIDYVGSWGPLILGHAHPEVLDFTQSYLQRGTSFGAPTEIENTLGELIQKLMPNLERLRLVSSGTEACMTAIRLARGHTGRSLIVKFTGNYHGHSDALLVKPGSGALSHSIAGSLGVPTEVIHSTVTARYNDAEQLREIFAEWGNKIAAVIVEPIAGNMGFVRARKEFLQELRQLCTTHSSVLIFDEVMTGFRVHLGGAQALYDIKPDLVTLGKVVGGGMPLAVLGGRQDIMETLAPLGGVYQAGTLSGNPVAAACGYKTLEILQRPGVFAQVAQQTHKLVAGVKAWAQKYSVPLQVECEGGMFGLFWGQTLPHDLESAGLFDQAFFNKLYRAFLERGVYLAPSAYEAGFVSYAHSDDDIAATLEACHHVFRNAN